MPLHQLWLWSIILLFGQSQCLQEAEEGGWTISYPTKPLVRALINETTGLWILKTWTHGDGNWTVNRDSSLTLTCEAPYPVVWVKAENDLLDAVPLEVHSVSQDQSDNPTPQEDIFKLKAADPYKAALRIGRFTKNATGTYICRCTTSNSTALVTAIDLGIDETTDQVITPQILQASFVEVLVQPASAALFTIVYSVPSPASNFKTYFLLPNGEQIQPYESASGAWMQLWNVSETVHKCILSISRVELKHEGAYQFVLEHLEKGSENLTHTFNLTFLPDTTEPIAEKLGPLSSRAYLLVDQVYELKLSFSKPPIDAMPELQASVRDQLCGYRRLSSSMAARECGIMGVTKISGPGHTFGLSVILQVTKSCRLMGRLNTNDTASDTRKSNMSITAIENMFSGSRDQRPIVQLADDVLRPNNVMYVNDTLTLTCMTPLCDLEWIGWCQIAWCKRQSCALIKPTDVSDSRVGNLTDDPLISTSYFDLNGHTLGYNLTFQSLQVNHSGVYTCGTGRPYSTRQSRVPMIFPAVNYNITVKDPVKPYFKDDRPEYVVEEASEAGDKMLLCQVSADPQATISWWGYDGQKRKLVGTGDTFHVTKPGLYECVADNGYGIASRQIQLKARERSPYSTALIIAVPLATVVILASVGLISWRRRRANVAMFYELARLLKEESYSIPRTPGTYLNDQAEYIPYDRNLEKDRSTFKLVKQIGFGQFGKVFKGEFKMDENDCGRQVAVKVPGDPMDMSHHRSLIAEFKVMSLIPAHVNVLSLVGVCTSELKKHALFVLTEYCEHGSLKDYLSQHWSVFENCGSASSGLCIEFPSTVDPLLSYAYQAANGMKHLAMLNIIHRDLALRNVLLAAGHVVKIADFGMSRRHHTAYQRRIPNTPMPIKWMALESLMNGEYTQKSDVWSFGVVLWELFSCKTPYTAEEIEYESLVVSLLRGRRLEKPKLICNEMYGLMLECWNADPKLRPTFGECKRRIGQMFEKKSYSTYTMVVKTLAEAWRHLSSSSPSPKLQPDTASTGSDDLIQKTSPEEGTEAKQEVRDMHIPIEDISYAVVQRGDIGETQDYGSPFVITKTDN